MKLISLSDEGHRREYVAQLVKELRAAGVMPRPTNKIEPLEKSPLLFMAIEDHPAVFAAVATLRSLLRRRTVGFMFRPGQCFTTDSLRHAIKRSVFRVVSRLPAIKVLTLLPHDIDPRFDLVSSGWLFDPQLWDLATWGPRERPTTQLQDDVKATAAGRRMLVALGDQNRDKGFEFLTRILQSDAFPHDRIIAVAAGCVARDAQPLAQEFVAAGGVLYDRRLSDDEFLGLCFDADLIWNCYAPEYDQASGIFGRAFQLGVPSVVRSGSYLVKLAERVGHPTVIIDPASPDAAAQLMDNAPSGGREEIVHAQIHKLRRTSLNSLLSALDVHDA